jgi:3-hydroxyisobutyrate dehydrogenase-like beta-hydroxyacid dehydrogenase
MSTASLALLGLGRMGTALAEQFLSAGVTLSVWDQSPATVFAFEGRATIAANPADAVRENDIIALCLNDYGTGLEVLDEAAGSQDLNGKILVQLTSGTASDARAMHAWSSMHGLDYLDAAILAQPQAIGSPGAIVLYSGGDAVWERTQETMAKLGGSHRFVGDVVGAAATLQCALQEYFCGAALAMLHGAALCNSEQLSLNEYFYLVKNYAATLSDTADTARSMISKEIYDGVNGSLDAHIAALRLSQRMSHDNDIDTRVPDAIMAAYKKGLAAGYGEAEIAALFEVLRHRAAS